VFEITCPESRESWAETVRLASKNSRSRGLFMGTIPTV